MQRQLILMTAIATAVAPLAQLMFASGAAKGLFNSNGRSLYRGEQRLM